ncbi:uncharacterized protein LOC106167222 [Lingula anatina]|uniref:Uncharacterized protein LOC106167222 n=1 Tax=Lingula anatina TaxID=7574 RepID=A0A1S3ITI7_LINAN|nr:uncharacterized protein LOC106167222 [Lingula anatina]|eukprot:XP_013401398.1 uncharacterized protein LOC106167222 [Lingula anatina]
MRTADSWREVGGSFRVPGNKDIRSNQIYLQGSDPSVSFLVDSASLKLIPELGRNWKADALQRIEQIRKADIAINLSVGAEYNLKDVEVQVKQTKSQFGFGGTVKASKYVEDNASKYRKFVGDTFEWATLENALKWRMMQWNKGTINYERPRKAIAKLLSQGLKIRGHNVVWGVEEFVPSWLKTMNADQIKSEINTRINDVVSRFKGDLQHWDVNNEIIAGKGDWFERHTGDRSITEKMFQMTHAIDPTVKLFHNEYNVISSGIITDAYVQMVQDYLAKGLPLSGIGVQGHFPAGPPDILKIQQNLDKLALTGIPIWVTELDIEGKDVNKRADYYEDVMTCLFSHPGVEGIVLWTWYDDGNAWRANVNIAQGVGDDFKLNAAGQRVQQLMTKTWKTNRVLKPSSRTSTLRLRVFKGDYTITLKYNGSPINEKKITVGDTMQIDMHTGSAPPTSASVTTTKPVPLSSGLTCVNRWSGHSDIGDDKPTDVSCNADEIMTGCSSRATDNSALRDGEVYAWNAATGRRVCRAHNGYGSRAAVQAIARCCKTSSQLQCSYHSSQASEKGDGKQASVTCPSGKLPTGCTTHTYHRDFDGSNPKMDTSSCVAQNGGPHGGVYAHAACCEASGLSCVTKYSSRSGNFAGNVTYVACDTGYTITGCNVFNEFGGTAGAFADTWGGNSYCLAINGKKRDLPNQGVKAVATCCKL